MLAEPVVHGCGLWVVSVWFLVIGYGFLVDNAFLTEDFSRT